jgi:ABC-type transport system substrate-binding protein
MNLRRKLNKKSSWPSLRQWRKLPTILSKKEKCFFCLLSVLFISSSLFLIFNLYLERTEIKPSIGGTHIEGLIGQPRFINPVYAVLNDADRDLSEIVYSGLMKYDKDGELIEDITKDFEIKDEGKIYEFNIKENVFWSDGEKLTTEDIAFTIETIQNSGFKSPLRAEWLGIEVEKISDYKIRFNLNKPSFVFLESTTLKILPKHIWNNIPLENFSLSNYNLEPVGSGPYKFKEINKEKSGFINSITLERNSNYYNEGPFISEVKFNFYNNEEELIRAARRKEINGFTLTNKEYFNNFTEGGFDFNTFILPRYFAIFLNTKKDILENSDIRRALNYATDKEEILNKILLGQGTIVSSPIMPELYGYSTPSQIYKYDLDKANNIFQETGFKDLDENGFRIKHISKTNAFQFSSVLQIGSQGKEVEELQKCLAGDPSVYPEGDITGYFGNLTKKAVISFQEKYAADILEPSDLTSGTGKVANATISKLNEICFPVSEEKTLLQFSLVTINQPQLIEVANLIKEQWKKAGVKLELEIVDSRTILENNFIRTREYDSLLFGQMLSSIPDPFPFWHSSQKKDPGLNLSIYESDEADSFLEKGRTSINLETQQENYEKFQDVLLGDAPAVFLYSPDYIYMADSKIKGINNNKIIDPSKRFSEINKWFIRTKRSW